LRFPSAAWAFPLALGLFPTPAAAQSKQECADAYIAGQVARKEGRLRDARARFEVCANSACPGALQRDCTPWKAQLDHDIPTLAVTVKDEAGAPLAGASVKVDGAPFASPGPLDPGEHKVHVEAPGRKPADQRVTLAVGESNHEVTVRLDPAAPAPSAGRSVPVAPIVLGAAGLAALGVFAGLGATGSAKKSDLDAKNCKPNCSSSDVDAVRSLYLGADVALGIGIGALAAAGVVLIVQLKAPAAAASAARFSPAPGGGAFTFHF
jgi:hypothetical protein